VASRLVGAQTLIAACCDIVTPASKRWAANALFAAKTVLGREPRGGQIPGPPGPGFVGCVLKRFWEATMETRTTVSGLGQSAPEVA
jgi:hypothetical protein